MPAIGPLADQLLRISTPYLFAAAGGVLAERAGVVSLTLEGYVLGGACGAVFGSFYSGTAIGGVAGAVAVGLALGALHAWSTVRWRADQIVTAVAINLGVVALTRYSIRVAFGSSSNSPRVNGWSGSLDNPLVIAGLLVLPILAIVVSRTRFGLRLRAVGESPAAATAAGVSVAGVRWVAVTASGALGALGGAYLALDQHGFTDEMSAGRGFIALAAVIFGGWRPIRAGLAALLFAAAEVVQLHLQSHTAVPSQLVATIPYVVTLVALVSLVGRSIPPAALGGRGGRD